MQELTRLVNRRKRVARRLYKKNPLFAVYEMKKTYEYYDEELLAFDIMLRSPRKKKRGKKNPKSIYGLRVRQIQKMWNLLEIARHENDLLSYNKWANLIAMYNDSHAHRRDITLTVKYKDENGNQDNVDYHFRWNTMEGKIQHFLKLVKQAKSHMELKELRASTMFDAI